MDHRLNSSPRRAADKDFIETLVYHSLEDWLGPASYLSTDTGGDGAAYSI
jgi:hypothetical protein